MKDSSKNVSDTKVTFPGVTRKMHRFFLKFPETMPKDACRILNLPYKRYGHMARTVKYRVKKYLASDVLGRLPKSLKLAIESHRVEWCLEKDMPMPFLLQIGHEAEKRKPTAKDPKPVGEWYVIPNRNRQREYHDEHVTIRMFPKSGTVRIIPGHRMAWPELKIYVQNAFFKGGLDVGDCERVSEQLVPHDRHKTFAVEGLDTTFKIDHYRAPLGLTILADKSHPGFIETKETWPSWIKPQLAAIERQTIQTEKQTDAITLLTEQIRLHLDVLKGIGEASRDLKKSVDEFTKTVKEMQRNKGK